MHYSRTRRWTATTSTSSLVWIGLSRVDVYDVRARTWVDVNPMDDVQGGFQLESPIVGLSSTPDRVLLQERNDVGNRVIGKAVAATMYNGAVVLLEADSGLCRARLRGSSCTPEQGLRVHRVFRRREPLQPRHGRG